MSDPRFSELARVSVSRHMPEDDSPHLVHGQHPIHKLAFDPGIKVIAEHVESAEILAALNGMGVEMVQGYSFIWRKKKPGAHMRWPKV